MGWNAAMWAVRIPALSQQSQNIPRTTAFALGVDDTGFLMPTPDSPLPQANLGQDELVGLLLKEGVNVHTKSTLEHVRRRTASHFTYFTSHRIATLRQM